MQVTISGKTYDTNNATLIASWDYAAPGKENDPMWHISEAVYADGDGNFFLHGMGGPYSQYGVDVNGKSDGAPVAYGESIRPMDNTGIAEWKSKVECLQRDKRFNDMVEKYAILNDDAYEDDTDEMDSVSVYIPYKLYKRISDEARERCHTASHILDETIAIRQLYMDGVLVPRPGCTGMCTAYSDRSSHDIALTATAKSTTMDDIRAECDRRNITINRAIIDGIYIWLAYKAGDIILNYSALTYITSKDAVNVAVSRHVKDLAKLYDMSVEDAVADAMRVWALYKRGKCIVPENIRRTV